MPRNQEDIELLEAFVFEAFEFIDEIEPQLIELGEMAQSDTSLNSEELINSIFRMMHTLKGGAGFLKLNNISKLCHISETLFDKIRNGKIQLESEHIYVLMNCCDQLKIILNQIQSEYHDETNSENFVQVLEQIENFISQPQSPAVETANPELDEPQIIEAQENPNQVAHEHVVSDISNLENPETEVQEKPEPGKSDSKLNEEFVITDEMKEQFLQESEDLLDKVENYSLNLENNLADTESLQGMLRAIHSLKGNAAFFGYNEIERLSHVTETLLESVKHKHRELDAEVINSVLQIKDVIKSGLSSIVAKGSCHIHGCSQIIELILDMIPRKYLEENEPQFLKPKVNSISVPSAVEKEIREEVQNEIAGNRAVGEIQDGKIILCVDDELTQLELLKKMLQKENYNCLSAVSGEDALQVIQTKKVDLCCLDVKMPGMNGVELCREINNRFPNIPVLVITGDGNNELVSQFLNLDIVGFLKKPLVKEELLVKIESGLAKAVKKGMRTSASEIMTEGGVRANQTKNFIRVDMTKLDKLMDLVGELIIAEEMLVKNPDIEEIERENFDRAAEHLHRISNEIQDISMSVRLVPIQPLFRKMMRLVHDLSTRFKKKIQLEVEGEDTEIDKIVLDTISDPLIHLIRNSADHGLESGEERKEAGKKEAGTITLKAIQKTNEIWVVVGDDGKGLNRDRILKKGIENGLVEGDGSNLSDNEIYQLIFSPGFSTASQITDVSGRGVGMDVVKKNLEKVKGKIDIQSTQSKGAKFIIRIPLSLSVIEGMLVRVGNVNYTFPIVSISESLRVNKKNMVNTPGNQVHLKLRDKIFPIYKLRDIYNIKNAIENIEDGTVLVLKVNGKTFGILVDEVLYQIETVVKPLSKYLGKVNGISGCNILGGGEISLIIDPESLADVNQDKSVEFLKNYDGSNKSNI